MGSVAMRNKLLYYLIKLLKGTEKPILTVNSYEILSKIELAAIVRNGTRNVNFQLKIMNANFLLHYYL